MNFRILAASALAFASVGLTSAGATTFTYTGNDFTTVQNSSFGTSLDIVLVTNAPIASNFTGSLTPSDFSAITATAVGGNPSSLEATVSAVEDFDLVDGQVSFAFIYTPFLFSLVNNFNSYYDPSVLSYDNIESFNNFQSMTDSNSDDPGTWTVTGETASAPEPGVWTMMILGAAGVGASLRRRRASAPRVAGSPVPAA